MRIEDLVGRYSIMGSNQDAEKNSYKGYLTLSLDENKRINAFWEIGNQQQFGNGFFKDNLLIINFSYNGEDSRTYKGVVAYKCLTANLLEGFWSEKHGDPKFLGEERCFKILEETNKTN
ncbi:hypothetical protein [Tenacibaculum sp. MAR_2009_124]|uniref:hypothetical protein n=1 Tax=Tenacibaculum sp. MAR_2009_124 TaxID=1250059 RepID=UPI000B82C8EB|nr:hypothetical protein [Tenacibaculum sp. MAR_2009_124]